MAKKYVLVIVEGASDKAALEVLFTRFCCPKGTETIVTHGDITSDKNVSESNIINKVKVFASERKLKKADIQHVVHIIDTDGVFIPDGRITQDDLADGFVYSDGFRGQNGVPHREIRDTLSLYFQQLQRITRLSYYRPLTARLQSGRNNQILQTHIACHFLALTSVISVTHLLKGLSALKSRFSRSSAFRASRSAFVIPFGFRLGLWVIPMAAITRYTVVSLGIPESGYLRSSALCIRSLPYVSSSSLSISIIFAASSSCFQGLLRFFRYS